MSEAARSRLDEARYEPEVAMPARDPNPRDAGSSDPLAELARLVGQDDPYRNVFRPAPAPGAQAAPERAQAGPVPRYARDAPGPAEPAHHDEDIYGDPAHHDEDVYGDPAHPGAEAHQAYDAGHGPLAHDEHLHGDPAHDPYLAHDDQYDAAERAAYPDEAGLADARLAPDYAADSALPDLWAQGDGPEAQEVDHPASHAPDPGGRSAARRPLAVLAAVLLLTGGGLAATFLAKGQTAATTAAAGRSAPTIMAASGPTKVKVDDGSATAPEDQDAALLNKTGTVSSGPVKIVSSQEQPADLAQLPKSDLADGARPIPPPSGSPFPEPKKVKTFLVHPDGTMLSGDPAAAAANPAPPGLSPGAVPVTAGDAAATPRTTAQSATTPRSAAPAAIPSAAAASPAAPPASIAALAADPAPRDTAAAPPPAKPGRQAASPGVRTASVKPSDAAATPSAGGSYGVQLASSPVEADANAAFAKLKRKYPAQLGAYTATVHRAETGDKPVYRVRVGGMGQDEAKALCSQLQSAGGSCFVMHN